MRKVIVSHPFNKKLLVFAIAALVMFSFAACENLTGINTAKTATSEGLAFKLINGDTEYEVSNGTATSNYIIIPETHEGLPVTRIATYAFYDSRVKGVAIPSTVTSVGNCAFYDCSRLNSITIPDSVMSIGGAAFSGCSSLESITVKSGNTIYRSEGNCLIRIADIALILGCKNSIIPNGVTIFGDYAFAGCAGLKSITIPDSVMSIGFEAFYDCSSLTSIAIPSGVTSISAAAFDVCDSLTRVFYGGADIAAWNEISIDRFNENLTSAVRYYYSETNPGTANTHWHWVDGAPAIWG